MAEVIHAGPFATSGEERTAQRLRNLPNDWVVICNKLLPTHNGRTPELDFIVIGDHLVFVLDEKAWSGRIHGSDQVWVRADGSSETSPLNKVDYLAKVVAGELRYSVAGLPDHGAHFVDSGIILSAATERPRVQDSRVQDRVFLLDAVVERLQEIDRQASHPPIVGVRAAIRQRFYNLQNRPKFARVIQDYEVEEVFQERPRSYRARARHRLTNESRVLSVYDVHGLSSEQLGFYRRELDAVRQLGDTGLAIPVGDPFRWSEDFLVLPVERPEGWRSLAAVAAPSGIEDLVRELTLAANAFATLAQVHARQIVHRALSPNSVYVPVRGAARSSRIRFTDFFAARIEGRETVAADIEALAIEDPYAAPEVAMGYALAEPSSDVFSLALTFYQRLTGESPADVRAAEGGLDTQKIFAQRWGQIPDDIRADLADMLARALGPGPMASGGVPRPSAAEVESMLRRVIGRLQTREAEKQGKLDERYRILRKLGEGTSGRVYLVEDELEDPSLPRRYVVKTFSRADQVIQQAGREFVLLKDISAPNVVRLYDHYPPTSNAHLKMAWIPGDAACRWRPPAWGVRGGGSGLVGHDDPGPATGPGAAARTK